jgi:hypothetical protein
LDLKKLVTLTFDKNVGPLDRIFRVLSGGGLIAAGWCVALPLWASTAVSVMGAMWMATAVLSRCSIYYALGYSTCPISRDGESRSDIANR